MSLLEKTYRYIFVLCVFFSVAGCGGGGGGSTSTPTLSFSSLCKNTSLGGKVFGTVYYENRLYDKLGFTGREKLPMRYADIELLRDDPVTGEPDIIGSSATNKDGQYCITYINPDHHDLWLRASTSTANTPYLNIEVINTKSQIYSVISKRFDDLVTSSAGKEVDIYATVFKENKTEQGPGGAFNILSVMADTSLKLIELMGVDNARLPGLTVRWESARLFGSKLGTFGSFYRGGPNNSGIIDVQGGDAFNTGDHDEYDDDIILHEFSHFVTDKLWKSDSPGGQHFLNGTNQDMRLSWSEGFASFFSAAIRYNPLMVDSFGGERGNSVALNFSYSMDNYSVNIPNTTGSFDELNPFIAYTSSEVAVSGVLWDMFDGINSDEPFDAVSITWSPILSAQSYIHNQPSRITFSTFWDGLLSKSPDTDITPILEIMKENKMEYIQDEYEPDNCTTADIPESMRPVSIGIAQHHTLYPAMDTDCFSIGLEAGKTYDIHTTNLTNGADTAMFIYDSSFALVASNDNLGNADYSACVNDCPDNGPNPLGNGGWPLASQADFSPTESDTYIIIIGSSSQSPASASRYGSYDIVVQEKALKQ